MADEDVSLHIKAQNATQEAFNAVSKALKALEQQTEASSTKTQGVTNVLKSFYAEHQKTFSAVAAGFKDAGVIVGALATGVTAVGAAVLALGSRGADVADVRAQFDILNRSIGLTGDDVLPRISAGLGNTVSNFELMKSVNLGLSQGLKLTGDQFQLVAEASRVLADRTGGDAKQAFDALITAMATGQDRGLKLIGVHSDATAATNAYARSVGKTTSELSESEKRMTNVTALLGEAGRIMKESGKAQDDFADAIARARKFATDFYDELSEGIANSSAFGGVLDALGSGFEQTFGVDRSKAISMIVRGLELGAVAGTYMGDSIVTLGDVTTRVFAAIGSVLYGALSVADLQRIAYLKVGEAIATAMSYIPGLQSTSKAALEQVHQMLRQASSDQVAHHNTATAMWDAMTQGTDVAKQTHAVLGSLRNAMLEGIATDEARAMSLQSSTKATTMHTGAILAQGSASAAATKQLDEYQKKIREITAAVQTAMANGAAVRTVSAQYGKAITDVMTQAGLLGQQVPKSVSDAFLAIEWDKMNAQMAAEWDRLMAIAQKSAADGQAANNKAFTSNLDAAISAQREALDLQNKRTLSSYDYQKTLILRDADDKKAALDKNGANYQAAMEAIDQATAEKMREASRAYSAELQGMEGATKTWSDRVNGYLADIPKLLQSALTGGGGVGGAVKALFSGIGATEIGGLFGEKGALSGVVGAVTSGASGLFGSAIGGALGSIIPGLGTAVGSMLGPAISKIGGAIKGLFTGGEGHEVNLLRDKFVAAEGGANGLNNAVLRATGSLELVQQLLNAKTKNAYAEAEKAITAALGEQEKTAQGAKTAFDSVVRSLTTTNVTSDRVQQALAAAFDAKTPAAFQTALEAVNGAIADTDSQQRQLDDTLKKYGLTWQDLGPTARAAKLGELANELIGDFGRLRGAGVDVNHTMEGMKPRLQDFVDQARKTGTEVPESMRGVIQTAIDAGVLFDENGQKITDMSETGLTFGQTMVEATRTVGEQIARLADIVNDKLGGAFISAAHQAIQAYNSVPKDWTPDFRLPQGGDYTEGYATGGVDDFGAGRRVTLHGLEAVIPLDRPSTIPPQIMDRILTQHGGGRRGGALPTSAEMEMRQYMEDMHIFVRRTDMFMKLLPGTLIRALRGASLLMRN